MDPNRPTPAGNPFIQANIAAPRLALAAVVLRTTRMVALGLNAGSRGTEEDLVLPNVNLFIEPAHEGPIGINDIKSAFIPWILGAGLREVIEAVKLNLVETRRLCAATTFLAEKQRTWGEWQAWQPHDNCHSKKFEGKGLEEMLKELAKDFGQGLAPAFTPELLTLNKLRNCLVHRAGIVGEKDQNDAGGLNVRWRAPSFFFEDSKGIRPYEPGLLLEDTKLLIKPQSERIKTFALGERIDLNAQEFSEIGLTILTFAKQMEAGLQQLMIDLGVPPHPGATQVESNGSNEP